MASGQRQRKQAESCVRAIDLQLTFVLIHACEDGRLRGGTAASFARNFVAKLSLHSTIEIVVSQQRCGVRYESKRS